MNVDSRNLILADAHVERKLACDTCNRETFHSFVVGLKEMDGSVLVEAENEYWIVQCKGCRDVSFFRRILHWVDVEVDEAGNHPFGMAEDLFPERSAGKGMPDWAYLLPTKIFEIYRETRLAIIGHQPRLASLGIRMLLEAAFGREGLKNRKLIEKIKELQENGKLTTEAAAASHALRGIGNAAAHEAKAPDSRVLELAWEVVDAIVFHTLVLPERAARLNDLSCR
jgi:Domain of unknown function (DUF4145)